MSQQDISFSSFIPCSSTQGMVLSRPHRSSLTIPASPSPLHDISMHTPFEADVRQACHTHSESYNSRHSGMTEGHVRQESGLSRHSHHSALIDPMSSVEPPVHPRQVHSLHTLTLTDTFLCLPAGVSNIPTFPSFLPLSALTGTCSRASCNPPFTKSPHQLPPHGCTLYSN